jgi:hypothetical protein
MPNDNLTQNDLKQLSMLQQIGASPDYSDNQQTKPEEKFLEQLNPSFLCKEFEMGLRGKEMSEQTKEWVSIEGIEGHQMINEKGIAEVMKVIRSKVNTNTVYSNLPEEIVSNIAIDSMIRISRTLALHYKDYNMSILDINTISNDATDFIYTALSRGTDALTLRLLRTMIQTKELTTTGIRDNKPSMNPLDILKRK